MITDHADFPNLNLDVGAAAGRFLLKDASASSEGSVVN